jgi:hypothetical protein
MGACAPFKDCQDDDEKEAEADDELFDRKGGISSRSGLAAGADLGWVLGIVAS